MITTLSVFTTHAEALSQTTQEKKPLRRKIILAISLIMMRNALQPKKMPCNHKKKPLQAKKKNAFAIRSGIGALEKEIS